MVGFLFARVTSLCRVIFIMNTHPVTIQLLGDQDISWAFGQDDGRHYLNYRTSYGSRQEQIDIFPCYHHPIDLSAEVLRTCTDAFPNQTELFMFIMQHEGVGRWNGYCDVEWDWQTRNEDGRPADFLIRLMINGKRTPLHPAMTRYVVSHEYGHAAEKWLVKQMGMKDIYEFRPFYKNLRGGTFYDGYSGRRWHENIGEHIANDFRILVAKQEVGYWPHPGYERPEKIPAIVEFWQEKVAFFKGEPQQMSLPFSL